MPQPWATLVVLGAKKIVIQTCDTNFRGSILIHASKLRHGGMKAEDRHQFIALAEVLVPELPDFRSLDFGAYIGTVDIEHTMPLSEAYDSAKRVLSVPGDYDAEREQLFGDFSQDGFCWILANPVQFQKPEKALPRRRAIWNRD